MCIVHPFPLKGPAAFACAQAGCRVCLDGLMEQHEGLVHYILRRQVGGDATYDELLQEGRITLWQAIVPFDSGRGVAFSTYAGVAIQHRIWRSAKREVSLTGELFWGSCGGCTGGGRRAGVAGGSARGIDRNGLSAT